MGGKHQQENRKGIQQPAKTERGIAGDKGNHPHPPPNPKINHEEVSRVNWCEQPGAEGNNLSELQYQSHEEPSIEGAKQRQRNVRTLKRLQTTVAEPKLGGTAKWKDKAAERRGQSGKGRGKA